MPILPRRAYARAFFFVIRIVLFQFDPTTCSTGLDDVVHHNPDAVGGVASSSSSSLANRINYSDLASILMDGGFDTCKVK